MLNLNMSPMVKGILIGVGVSAVGFYAYKHNEEKVDNFLRSHGVKVKTPTAGFETMSVEDLMRTSESIEDLIAEKEQQEQSVTVEADAAGAAELHTIRLFGHSPLEIVSQQKARRMMDMRRVFGWQIIFSQQRETSRLEK